MIKPQPNEFADEFLDIVGQEFRFDHSKGLPEWMKNSADAYTREEVPDDEQVILVELVEHVPKRDSVFRVIDFVGMQHADIVQAFKRWGDPRAAARGTGKRTLGGHGNGGKFYMRQMFSESRFVTYRDGRLNVYGFNRKKQYGFMEEYEDAPFDLDAALAFAGIDLALVPGAGLQRLGESAGFTVVIGNQPQQFAGRATSRNIVEKLIEHPQARRLMMRKPIFVRVGKNPGPYVRLEAHDPQPRPDFVDVRRYEVPVLLSDGHDDEQVFRDAQWPDAHLELHVSRDDLRHKGADRIDFLGEVGVIGTYAVHELGGPVPGQAEFIYGECFCPKLEDPEEDCVKNDREKLVDTAKVRSLLAWVRSQVSALALEVAQADAEQQRAADLSQSSAFNELLNQWKNKFMPKLMAQLFGGPGEGSGFGGVGEGEGGTDGDDDPVLDGDANDADDEREGGSEGGGGDERKTGPRSPTVLLSSFDADPLDPLGGPIQCSARHPAVYQRYEDLANGIYWINATRPLAQRILDDYGPQSTRWRDYMFQRYIEIILKESIHELERKQGVLSADLIDGHINELYMQVHDQAEEDLSRFLFDEKMAE